MKTTIKSVLSLVITSITLIGCAKYKPRPLHQPISTSQEKNGVEIQADVMDKDAFQNYFGRNIENKGYKAIQLCVRNNSQDSYAFKAKNIDLDIANRNTVGQMLRFNTTSRFFAWAIPGLFIWPLLIPACGEAIMSDNANKQLEIDFNERVLSNDSCITLYPGSSINKVMFVKAENFRTNIPLTLKNKQSKEELSFIIKL